MRYQVEQEYQKKKKGLEGEERKKINEKIKSDTARRLLESKPEEYQPDLDEIKKEIMEDDLLHYQEGDEVEELLDKMKQTGTESIGHTWVKFRTYNGNTLLDFSSFGFHPEETLTSANQTIPGKVVSPDEEYESYNKDEDDPGSLLYIDYDVKPVKYNKALTKAKNLTAEPPTYKLFGYNCTAFAREVVKSAGISFPKQADVYPSVSTFDRMVEKISPSPDLLYEILEKKKK